MKTFINYVEQSVDDIYYSKVYNMNLYPKIHQVFYDFKLYMEMIGRTSNLFHNSEVMFIAIGQVIEHLFDRIKPVGFNHFLKLYEFMLSNLVWILQQQPKYWNIHTECNLCGDAIFDKI